MTLKEAVYLASMLTETEEFTANMDISLDLVNHMSGKQYTLDTDVSEMEHSKRIIDFMAIDIKRNMSNFELFGTTATNVQMARDNKLVALEALFSVTED